MAQSTPLFTRPRKLPLDARRRGGQSKWAGLTDEQRAAQIEAMRQGARRYRAARAQAALEAADAEK